MDKNIIFENILDECLDSIINGKGTLEQCLQRYPEHAAELEPLLLTAVKVNRAVGLKPSAEFKARAHYQMQLHMAQTGAPRKVSFWALQPKWVVATMTAMLVFLMGGGTVLAADASMPGNPLYPVKIAVENLSVNLTGSDLKKAELYTALAERRMTEMTYVVENGKTSHIESIANRYADAMVAINTLVGGSEPMLSMTGVSSTEFGTAAMPEAGIDKAADPTLATPPRVAGSEDVPPDQSEVLTVTESPWTPAPEIAVTIAADANTASEKNIIALASDKDKLKIYVTYNLLNHPDKLEKLLDRVPEANKNTIRRMISDSLDNSQQILKKLEKDD